MEDNLIIKALKSKNNKFKNEEEIIQKISDFLNNNFDLLKKANQIDIKNNNGYEIDLGSINTVINRYLNLKTIINPNDILITEDNLMFSKLVSPYGIILTSFEGDFYHLLELILLSILTHNVMIFTGSNYFIGSNKFLVESVNNLLKQKGYKDNFYYELDSLSLLENFKSIDKLLVIGENDFQMKYLNLSKMDTFVSGAGYYEIYIEDDSHIDLIKKIASLDKNITIYLKEDINIDIENAIIVSDIHEAISAINYNGSGYSSSIFSSSSENISMFLSEIKARNIFVNTSPTLEQKLDVTMNDLVKNKYIVMPNAYTITEDKIVIPIV